MVSPVDPLLILILALMCVEGDSSTKNLISVIICSLSCHSKAIWLSLMEKKSPLKVDLISVQQSQLNNPVAMVNSPLDGTIISE